MMSSNVRNEGHFSARETQETQTQKTDSASIQPLPTVNVEFRIQSRRSSKDKVKSTSSNDVIDKSTNQMTGHGRIATSADRNTISTRASLPLDDDKTLSRSFDARCKKVGQYLLGSTLGEGSYGKVRLATHLITKQQVAIKVVTKKLLVLREAARRHFRREALLLQHVQHPNIVRLYEAMETTSSYYLVFELASGGHLLDHVSNRGRLSEDEVRHYMRQIVSALDHLHRSGIVHRDLKLENFLLNTEGHIKLVDFGLSSICHDSDHHLSTQCGSPVYAAPELFAGRKYGKPVDIWSLGVCMFAMLTGRLPFLPSDETSLLQLYTLILKGCTLPGHLSPSCQNLLSRMLDLNEGSRITVEEILSHHWLMSPDDQPIKRYPAVPRKLQHNVINLGLVKYMCAMYRFSEHDVITSVLGRKLSASAATYNILKDNIEAGSVTLSFPGDKATSDRASSPKKITKNQHLHDSEERSLEVTNPKTNMTIKASPRESPTNSSKSTSRTQSKEKPHTPNSYKSCILVLKRSRHQIRQKGSAQSTLSNEKDCVVVGKSAPNMTTYSLNNDVTDSPEQHHESVSSAFALPPISSSGDVANGAHLKSPHNEVQGQRHYIHRDHAHSVRLDVKGVAPCIYDRNAPLISDSAWSYQSINQPSHIMTHNFPFQNGRQHRTPPPPPPNSSFGKRSDFSSLSRYNDSQSGPTTTPCDGYHPSDHAPHHTDEPRYIMGKYASPTQPDPGSGRSVKDPIRPTLASLRDPFGRDTWSRNKAEQRQRKEWSVQNEVSSAGQFRRKMPQRSEKGNHVPVVHGAMSGGRYRYKPDAENLNCLASSSYGLSFPGDLKERPEDSVLERLPSAAPTLPHGQTAYSTNMAELGVYDDTGKESPSWFRNETDSPLSQSQDRDDFMTPVTRVTITTIGRH